MRLLAALLTSLFASLASATTVSTDYSDMWWVPSESGWGANMIQQGDTLFVTLFVYGANGSPTWFVAPQTTFQGSGGAATFTGPLFQTTGPYYGAASFNPASVAVTQVGSLTFVAAAGAANGTLTYSVNGVNVTKAVQRQTWRTETIAGSYRGATIGTYTGCPGTSTVDLPITLTISQTASSVNMNEFGPDYTCHYTGTLTQTGKIASIVGTATCAVDGAVQNFTASNIQVSQDSVSMALTTDTSTCHFSGRIGGMRQQ